MPSRLAFFPLLHTPQGGVVGAGLSDPLHREAMAALCCLGQRLAGGDGIRANATTYRPISRDSSFPDEG